MNLSIQNEKNHRTAKELASLTGESIAVAVRDSQGTARASKVDKEPSADRT